MVQPKKTPQKTPHEQLQAKVRQGDKIEIPEDPALTRRLRDMLREMGTAKEA